MLRFVFQTGVIVLAVMAILAFIVMLKDKKRGAGGSVTVKNLNKRYKRFAQHVGMELQEKDNLTLLSKIKGWLAARKQAKPSRDAKARATLFVLDFKGDISASACDQLREEVSSLLLVAQPNDRVLLRLESPGGVVHGYGLAASQLQRIRDKGLTLIVSVDKVAASGGYMMACVANRILTAPFAVIGSIGVLAAMPNLHKFLRKRKIDYLEVTAGEFKRTVTPLGEITESGMNKFQEQIDATHALFKEHVQKHRADVEIDKVATGEFWYGTQALALGLVDEIGTSDDFILANLDACRVIHLQYEGEKKLKQKIADALSVCMDTALTKALDSCWRSRLP